MMKFEIIGGSVPGNSLQITAENPTEVRELIRHYNLDPFEYVEALSTGVLTYAEKATGYNGTAEWHAFTGILGPQWLTPYMDTLNRITGYKGPIPDICVPAQRHSYTHTIDSARISYDGYHWHGYKMAGEWHGMTAAQYARKLACEYAERDIGDEKHEPEFIALRNGLYKPNPNYHRRHAPHPACTNSKLFGAILQWWIDTQATPKQRETLEKAFATHKTVCKTETLAEWLLREYQGLYVTWGEGGFVSFDQFKGL